MKTGCFVAFLFVDFMLVNEDELAAAFAIVLVVLAPLVFVLGFMEPVTTR